MPDATTRTPPPKTSPQVHAILTAWRGLTGGSSVRDADRRTLVACSGGADSSALVLALAHHPGSIVVSHVVHDMRPPAEAKACLSAAQSLAQSLSLPFVSTGIAAKPAGGNYEAQARKLRYAALAEMARAQGCRYVATGHHAEDQLETVLLRLLRGAGPRGLSAIRARRRLTPDVTLIRPMLAISRADAQALCRASGWQWSEDATNTDLSHKRAALRAKVLPALLELEPAASKRAAEAARLASLTADHLDRECQRLQSAAVLTAEPNSFDRRVLQQAHQMILLTWLRSLNARTPLRALHAAAMAIRSTSGENREFALGDKKLTVHADRVSVTTRVSKP